jgi:hypothetical protein
MWLSGNVGLRRAASEAGRLAQSSPAGSFAVMLIMGS